MVLDPFDAVCLYLFMIYHFHPTHINSILQPFFPLHEKNLRPILKFGPVRGPPRLTFIGG